LFLLPLAILESPSFITFSFLFKPTCAFGILLR
jgi:hypothetical protein